MNNKELGFSDVFRFVAGYWLRQPVRFAAILVMLAIGAGLETYLPTALSRFLEEIRNHGAESTVLWSLGLFLGIYLTNALLMFINFVVYQKFETRTFKVLMDDVFRHVQRLPEHFFVNTFAGSIISKINRARSKVETFEDRVLIDCYQTALILIGSILFLAMYFPVLAGLVSVYVSILLLVSGYLIIKISGPAQSDYAAAQDKFVGHMADSISGIATTRAYAQREFEEGLFLDETQGLMGVNRRAYHLNNVAGFIQRLILCGMLALLMGGGAWYFFQGKATVEDMAYLAFAYTIMQSYIQRLTFHIKDLMTSAYDLHAVIHLLREPVETPQLDTLPNLSITRGEIAFDGVTFTYPGKAKPVFDALSVTIRSGERVALVGHSGSGKTTFVRLLQQLYPLQGGRIVVDGQDVTTGSPESLRRAMALVPQDPILFHRSLAENIAYARPEAGMEAIQKAAQQAHIHDFIMGLPQGYDTLVGERGIKLSGGERQRIAIARALLADRPILILDEATSALDSASERAIQDGLHVLTHGRTSILIAHRLSTILDADRILVFDKGRIVEEGTHADLVQREGGIYARLFALQSGGFIVEPDDINPDGEE